MIFTDDDLKRLKQYIDVRQKCSMDVPVHPDIASFFSEVEALLARLEAVERFVDHSFMPIEREDHPDYIAWRISKGYK